MTDYADHESDAMAGAATAYAQLSLPPAARELARDPRQQRLLEQIGRIKAAYARMSAQTLEGVLARR